MREIGDRWQRREIRIIHEHLATEVTRSYLSRALESVHLPESAPTVLVATVPQQVHDIGALAAAVVSVSAGWHAVYIGSNTPVEEIASAAGAVNARLVLLSFTYPSDADRHGADLAALRDYLPRHIGIIVGGTSTEALDADAVPDGVAVVSDFSALREALRAPGHA